MHFEMAQPRLVIVFTFLPLFFSLTVFYLLSFPIKIVSIQFGSRLRPAEGNAFESFFLLLLRSREVFSDSATRKCQMQQIHDGGTDIDVLFWDGWFGC